MYSTIPKDKIDKQVIDFIYKLFVLLIHCFNYIRGSAHFIEHTISLAGWEGCKKRCGYGTAHAKVHTQQNTNVQSLIQSIWSTESCQAAMLSISHNACGSVDAANDGTTSSEAQSHSDRKTLLTTFTLFQLRTSGVTWTTALFNRIFSCVKGLTLFTNQAITIWPPAFH